MYTSDFLVEESEVNVFYRKALGNYKIVKKIMTGAQTAGEIGDYDELCTVAYLIQQAYETLLKGYMRSCNIPNVKEHNIAMLMSIANKYHPSLETYASKLSKWEASVRYNYRSPDTTVLQQAIDDFPEIYKYYYREVTDQERVDRILYAIDMWVNVDDVMKLLPKKLPDDKESLVHLVKLAISSMCGEDSNEDEST